MGVPTQAPGLVSESLSAAATNGFLGWSPEADRSQYTVRGGADGSAATAYADSTAYAVGKTVTYGGKTYVVRTAVGSGNTTKPDVNSAFVLADNRKGPAEIQAATVRRPQFYR
ncbi:hypothetical protein [Micromonospora robiginosa]|uniref:Uncharacterized protein n=1 Tax=Micromonospora robiginosa TaxID=2749844 RepID=A0A7L6B806_9ACTN|nr:hypothetical protein [Micromonospora ferruginea]QLQ37985.1 hypothetical protein H1D33_03575 [Micromonospora ferruginea]